MYHLGTENDKNTFFFNFIHILHLEGSNRYLQKELSAVVNLILVIYLCL